MSPVQYRTHFEKAPNEITVSNFVGGQKHCPMESRYFSGFVISVQVLVPSQGQELVPIAVRTRTWSDYRLDKYLIMFPCNFIKLTGSFAE